MKDVPFEAELWILTSRCSFPLWFAKHSFILLKYKDTYTRFEVFHKKKSDDTYVYKNALKPFEGLLVFSGFFYVRFRAKVLKQIQVPSLDVFNEITKVVENYPFRRVYSFLGNNSNTFTRFILKSVNVEREVLPWNCFGN